MMVRHINRYVVQFIQKVQDDPLENSLLNMLTEEVYLRGHRVLNLYSRTERALGN